MILFIDIETYSSVDLRKANVYRYSESPDFEILMAAWSVDGGEPEIAIGEQAILEIPGLLDPRVKKVAHNAQFERVCLSQLHPELLDPEQWIDTAAMAAEAGYPQSLDMCAKALGADPKDSAGTRLIHMFCMPRRGKRKMPEDAPEDWQAFISYCLQDVRTLIDIFNLLPEPTEIERRVWLTDQRVNDHGIRVDVEMAEAAVRAAEENRKQHLYEAWELTGVDNPNSVQQMLGWLRETGLQLPDLRADTVREQLQRYNTADQRRVLELRQELALSTAAKYEAALRHVCDDGRLRGAFRFFGAHTGRWAGRGVQLQNLARATVDDVPAVIKTLKSGEPVNNTELKGLVRALFTGPFTVVDYSAIEARVIAWLADEQWALKAFADGRDIYVETAERMGGLTRSQGKVAVLALGYAGGVNSLRVMGAEGEDHQLEFLRDQWRKANRKIVKLWSLLEESWWEPESVGKHLTVEHPSETDRSIILPSGRAIQYHGVKWEHYRVQNPVTKRWIKKEGWRYSDPKSKGRIGTYGGRLVENVTQAVARDILAEALVRLESRGYPVAGHIHDEVLVDGSYPVQEVADVMCEPPTWAGGLPLDGEGGLVDRYQKM